MKKIILLLSLLLISVNAFATDTLVLTEQDVGKYQDGKIIAQKKSKTIRT